MKPEIRVLPLLWLDYDDSGHLFAAALAVEFAIVGKRSGLIELVLESRARGQVVRFE